VIDLRGLTTEQLQILLRSARATDPNRLLVFDEIRRRALARSSSTTDFDPCDPKQPVCWSLTKRSGSARALHGPIPAEPDGKASRTLG
jgi:hypothetical protein